MLRSEQYCDLFFGLVPKGFCRTQYSLPVTMVTEIVSHMFIMFAFSLYHSLQLNIVCYNRDVHLKFTDRTCFLILLEYDTNNFHLVSV